MKQFFTGLSQIRWKLWLGIPLAVILVLVIAFQAMVRTDWFQNKVRARVIAEIERATGGRVQMGAFLFDPSVMTLSITQLIVHGTEPPGDPPLLLVPSLRIELSLVSLLAAQVSVRTVQMQRPEAHISVADDGSTNLPGGASARGTGDSVATLLDLAVDRLQLEDGSLYWNNVLYRLSVEGENLKLGTRYEPLDDRYAASFRVGRVKLGFGESQPALSEAEGELYIYRDRIEMPRLLVSADGLKLEAHARTEGWQQPKVEAGYVVRVELEPWKQRLKILANANGTAEVHGELTWGGADQHFAYSGKLQLDGTVGGADSPEIRATADYAGDATRARLRKLDVSAFGGRFQGEAELDELRINALPRWRLSGDFDGYSIRSVLDVAARAQIEGIPSGLPWSSGINGWLRAEGTVDTVSLSTSLILKGPENLPANREPLDGVVDAVYHSQDKLLQFSRVDLTTRTANIAAHGSVTADGRSILDLRVSLQDLTDLSAGAALAGLDLSELPVELHGEASLDGRLAGQVFLNQPPELRFNGQVEARDFQTAGYSWSHFTGSVDLDSDQLRIEKARIEDADGNAQASLQMPLSNYRLSDSGPLSGVVRFSGLAVERLLAALHRTENVSGPVAGQIQLAGTIENPELSGHAAVSQGKAWGEPFQSADITAQYAHGRLKVANFELLKKGTGSQAKPRRGRVTGDGEFTLADRSFEFDLRGTDWNLQELEKFAKVSSPPSGDLELELHASGRLGTGANRFDQLNVSGKWSLGNVALGDQPVGLMSGNISTQGEQVQLDWQADILGGDVRGKAELHPAGDQTYQGQMEFKKVPALGVARLAHLPLQQMQGEIDGIFTFSGNLSDENSLKADGTINRLEVGLAQIPGSKQGYSLWNPFPLRWSLAEGRLKLDGMRLLGQGTDIGIEGSIPFSLTAPIDRKLDVAIEGDFNMSLLESYRPDLHATGVSTVEVNVRGTIDTPLLRGRLVIRNASLRSDEIPNSLSDMNGTLTFSGRRVRIDELKATSGGGTVRVNGTAGYEDGQMSYRLTGDAAQVRMRYPADMSSTINGQITFAGNDQQSLLTGEITVTRLTTSPDLNLGGLISSLGEPQHTPAGGSLLRSTQLNIQISSTPDLPVQTSMFRNMQLEIDMRLVGTAISPSLLGNISVTQGEMRFQGTRYVINRGEIYFNNPFRIEPVLDFELETRIRDVDIALNISGPARNMNLSYRSDPPLEFNQLVSLIAVGRSPTTDPVIAAQERVEAQPLIQAGANTLLSQALSRPFSKGLQRFFGVSRLRVDPQAGGAEAVPTARISTEQQITNDLTLIYSYNLADSEQQSVRVEWAPNRRWSFIVTRDENGLVGADLLYKKRLP